MRAALCGPALLLAQTLAPPFTSKRQWRPFGDPDVQQRSPLAAAIGAGEESGLAAQSQATQRPLGGVVGETDAAVLEEAGERGPAFEHLVHGAGQLAVARQAAPLFAHSGFLRSDQLNR